MKKIICVFISILVLLTSLCVWASASADSNGTYNFEIDDSHYTVEFADNSLSAEEQERVAAKLIDAEVNGEPSHTYGLGCTLFGHDYKYTTANVITHKVRTYAPRCKKQTYDVTYCEDCDYTEQTLISTSYIYCCAEE